MAAVGDHHVGEAARGFDKAHVAGANRGEVLLHHHLDGAAALGHIALQTADEPPVAVHVEVDRQVDQFPKGRIV